MTPPRKEGIRAQRRDPARSKRRAAATTKRGAGAAAPIARFSAVLLEGHKGAAVEVPFDPAQRWGSAPRALWPGRRGHPARGILGGVRFESAIVPRSGRFWLLVDETLRKAAKVKVGDTIRVALESPED